MAVEGVPLFIGGGEAEHSAEMLRLDNFFGFRGQEGWLTAEAGRVAPLDTPGTGVQLSPGPFLINSRFAGGGMQAYMGRILQTTQASTTNVPPGNPRSDLVVMNVEDPYPSDASQWPYPGAPGSTARQVGPYINIRVIDDVPPTTLSLDDLPTNRPERGWTAIPAARLDRDAGTGTVTAAMIVPLRSIINPWAGIQLPQAILDNLTDLDTAVSLLGEDVLGLLNQKYPVPATWTDTQDCNSYADTRSVLLPNTNSGTPYQFQVWPYEAYWPIMIPPWATFADVFCVVTGGYQKAYASSGNTVGLDANLYGCCRFAFSSSRNPAATVGTPIGSMSGNIAIDMDEIVTDRSKSSPPGSQTRYDPSGTPTYRPGNRPNIIFAGGINIVQADRGMKRFGQLQVTQYPDRATHGALVADSTTSVYVNIQFKEKP